MNKKKICFDLKEFEDFFWMLDLNCKFDKKTGNIKDVDGIILKGKIKEE